MTKILIRAGRAPHDLFSGYDTLERNPIGNNNGNLLFSHAVHKLLSSDGVSVDAHGLSFNAKQAPVANEKYDAFVLPLANAFRPSFEGSLKALTYFIEKLKIPTIMLSGGAQSGPDGTFSNLLPMKDTVTRFCRAVLKTSSAITVRGEKTAEYIRSLGFNEVQAIGCPSMTLRGPNHRIERPTNVQSLAYNIESSKDICAAVVDDAEKHYQSVYYPQDIATLEMMLWGVNRYSVKRDARLPLRSSHDEFASMRAEYHIEPYAWMASVRRRDFSFGPRIHGNVIAINSGTPAVVLAHDSRTEELADYHGIPYFRPSELSELKSVDQVLERADYRKFNDGQAERVKKVINFLHENGLKTIYDADQSAALQSYEEAVADLEAVPPVTAIWADMSSDELWRLSKQRNDSLKLAKLESENRKLKAALKKVAATLVDVAK